MIYCFLADGFEEVEALAPIDILRRSSVPVTTVGVTGKVVRGSHGIDVTADMTVDAFKPDSELQGVILPGGMPGTENLYASRTVREAVDYCAAHGLYVCAICAAPSVPGRMGLLSGRRATCFPGFEDMLNGATYTGEKVTADGTFITAKGAGCALDFGFAIVAALRGRDVAQATAGAMQC